MKPPPSLYNASIIFKSKPGGMAAYLSGIILFVLAEYSDLVPGSLFYIAIALVGVLFIHQLPSLLGRTTPVIIDTTGIQIDGLDLVPWQDIRTFALINRPSSWPDKAEYPEVRITFNEGLPIPKPQFPRNLFHMPVTLGTKAIILKTNQMKTEIAHVNGFKKIVRDIEIQNLTAS